LSSIGLFQKLIDAVEEQLKHYHLSARTGPTIRVIGQSKTLAYNLFLEERQELLKSLENVINSALSGLKAEIISLKGSGTIQDLGISAFQILQSITWEVYLYDPEDFAYIRLFHERDPEKGTEWLSLDVDYVEKSAWFHEE
jgi:hypothetical protein